MPEVDRVVFFTLQYFIKEYLIRQWNKNFFERDLTEIITEFKGRMDKCLGVGKVGTLHIEALHNLGYLPLEIRAVPEGSRVNLRVPMMVMWNTNKDFEWLTNYLETIMSTTVWGGCTSATMANEYRGILEQYAERTGGDPSFIDFQGHDFSCRGMFGFEAGVMSGAAHLLSFKGTDTVGAVDFIEKYYSLNGSDELIGASVPATEHSVMCLGGDGDDEYETIKRLITDVYPTGPISIVCDTWDFFKVLTDTLPRLKDIIMARDGTVIIRPDSGDPADIICGKPADFKCNYTSPEYKGAVELLWDTFGGTTTEKGYKQLDKHIGLIYGDSITLDRCRDICSRLAYKGFASTNVVFGIGSYTYQYTTRDVFGFAVKATYAEIDGKPVEIFKKPKTDDGTKNSAKGLTAVHMASDGNFYMHDQSTWDHVKNCALELVFRDGVLIRNTDISEIRETLRRQR
jgi:nicotinamide phosphoribosyltransferase